MKGLSAIDLIQRDLVLIGGGHSHVQVILNFAMRPLKGVRVTLISDQIYAPYSGMFPAYLAGIYSFADIHFDLSRICKNAGVRFLQAKVTGLDYQKKTIFLKKRPPLSFDVASVNVGSEPDTSILKGDKDKLILMKPIYRFIGLWDEFIREMNQSELKPLHIAMVGGGASGIEVALVIKKRFADKIESFHLFQSQSELLVGHNKRVKQLFEKELEANKIELHLNSRVVELIEGGLKCSNGETYLADKIFWATRAAAKDWFAGSNLPTDQKGFLQVDDSLQVRNCQDLFGAGDCIQFAEQELPKSGVFAVREGPILAHNLRSRILNQGSSLIPYRPQKRSLALISRGERSAVASYGPWSFEGEWVWRWKDYIDTKFMARFRLDSPLQTGMNSLAMAPLEYDFLEEKDLDIEGKLHSCGGCGAKLGPEILSEVLASVVQEQNQMVQVGLQDGEDGAVVEIPPAKLLVSSTDSMRDFIGDPFLFGQLAAIHSLNDIFAMGARPYFASLDVQIHHIHELKAKEELSQILSGLGEVFRQEKVSVLGGHTLFGRDTRIGIHAMGFADPGQIMRKSGLRQGDEIVLTKPIGTGALLVAQMAGQAEGAWIGKMINSMLMSGEDWVQLFSEFCISAVTDVSGFGLCRHLWEMIQSSELAIELSRGAVPILSGAAEALAKGFISPLARENRISMQHHSRHLSELSQADTEILFDPQTAGGFLLGVSPSQSTLLINRLNSWGLSNAKVIGLAIGAKSPQILLVD